jgi:type IV secretion system protein VirB7
MIKKVFLLLMATALGGCASLSYPVPKCDGYSRRPLNRSMWQWEDKSDLKRKRAEVPSIAPSQLIASAAREGDGPSPFDLFDIPSSYRRCEA